jgi:hypothetical protein
MSATLKDTCQFTNFLKIRSKIISPETIKPEATHQGGVGVFTKLHIKLIKIYIYYIYIYYIYNFAVIEDHGGELWVTLCIAALFQRRDLVSIRCIASFQIMENTDM